MKEGLLDFLLGARRRLVEGWQAKLPLAELRAIAEEERSQLLVPPIYLGSKLSEAEPTAIAEMAPESEMGTLLSRPASVEAPLVSLFAGPEDGLLRMAERGDVPPRSRFGNHVFLLRNGFFQSEFDVLETAAMGFDGMCAHARGLDHYEVQYLTELCRDFQLSLVVWIESEETLRTVLQTDAPYIGINGYGCEDFSENSSLLTSLAPRLPSTCVRLAWLRGPADRRALPSAGIRAVVGAIR